MNKETFYAAGEQLVLLAQTARDSSREIRGRLGLGRVLQKRDRHEESRRELDQALQLATADHVEEAAAEAEYLIASDLERRGLWVEALERFGSAANRAAQAGAPLEAARARQATARILARRGRYQEAL